MRYTIKTIIQCSVAVSLSFHSEVLRAKSRGITENILTFLDNDKTNVFAEISTISLKNNLVKRLTKIQNRS